MSFKKNYANEMNLLLMKRRSADDSAFTLNIPEHRLKRYAEKFNWAIKQVYNEYSHKAGDVMMFHIILSLQEFFDMDWAVQNLLNTENINQIKEEMSFEYNMVNNANINKGIIDEEE
jgi:hypothetical protein